MELNDLLTKKSGLDISKTLVLRHRPIPQEPLLRKWLHTFVVDRPELFNAYQQTQDPRVEGAFSRANYIVSFVGIDPRSAVFAGLYAVQSAETLNYQQFWQIPENILLKEQYGMTGLKENCGTRLRFDLTLQKDFHPSWIGKLCVAWPGSERSWFQWAKKNVFDVLYIAKESLFIPIMPRWDELILTRDELWSLPVSWRAKLEEWRAIYYIFDCSDRCGYVGSAYGEDNLLGRWQQYAKTGHGGNMLLRGRDPKNFRFSILQLLERDAESDDVIAKETYWKKRLHTGADEGGLNNN